MYKSDTTITSGVGPHSCSSHLLLTGCHCSSGLLNLPCCQLCCLQSALTLLLHGQKHHPPSHVWTSDVFKHLLKLVCRQRAEARTLQLLRVSWCQQDVAGVCNKVELICSTASAQPSGLNCGVSWKPGCTRGIDAHLSLDCVLLHINKLLFCDRQ